MKKYLYLFLIVIATSCTEDIKFNNPAIQGLKDNVFWRAATYKASLNTTGNLIIEGSLGYEKVVLQTSSAIKQSYSLGVNGFSKASYANTFPKEFIEFSTATKNASGQIVITEFDTATNTVSGTFRFTALNKNAADTENPKITFTEGVFYKVPVTPTLEY